MVAPGPLVGVPEFFFDERFFDYHFARVDVDKLHEAAGYMNVPPTELARMVKKERDPEKRREMQKALDAWRLTQGNPLARSAARVAQSWLGAFVRL